MTAEAPEAPKMGESLDVRGHRLGNVEIMDAIERRLHGDGVPTETVYIVAPLDFCQGLRHVAAMDGVGRMSHRMITGKIDLLVARSGDAKDKLTVRKLDETPLFEVLLG